MRASFQWLRSLVEGLPDDAAKVAERFTAAGLEVEAIEPYGEASEHVVVAKVVTVQPHPQRDTLRIVVVDYGSTIGPATVVCGAPNIPEPGGLVVFAPTGTHLPAKATTLEPREIAGVASEGMLCSEAELGLTDDGTCLLVLPSGLADPGTTLATALPATRDTIFDIGLTPNRPDGLGHVGLARELSALFGLRWNPPSVAEDVAFALGNATDRAIDVFVEDGESCPHYSAAVIGDVMIGPSPAWLRYRLTSLGMRAVSNAVDVTNLVMVEFGQPLHAFDLDQIQGDRITVRRARDGELLKTLDGVERTLASDDVVVADARGPIALAGVMGGEATEVRKTTRRVLLECAYFEPKRVRRTARRHSLHTDGSHRFERGIDWGGTERTLGCAVGRMQQLTGGAIVGGASIAVAKVLKLPTVSVRTQRVEHLLGVHVSAADIARHLKSLGFVEVRSDNEQSWWKVPSHRPDVAREVDLIEEVLRLVGIDTIPSEVPAVRPSREEAPVQNRARRVRAVAVEIGLCEAVTYSFVSPELLHNAGAPAATIGIKNPLGEASVMRTSLVPGLLQALQRARRHGEQDVRYFSIGAVFLGGHAGAHPDERTMFTAVLAGHRSGYLERPRPLDVWDGKGLVEELLERFGELSVEVEPFSAECRPVWLHPRGAARVLVAGTAIGCFGILHPEVVHAFELSDNTIVAELDLNAVFALDQAAKTFHPLPRFPSSMRDLALVVRETISAGEVERAVRDAAGPLAERVELFDRFAGKTIAAEHVSLALRVIYRASDRTLTDLEVDAQHAKVLAEVHAKFGAVLRT